MDETRKYSCKATQSILSYGFMFQGIVYRPTAKCGLFFCLLGITIDSIVMGMCRRKIVVDYVGMNPYYNNCQKTKH